MWVGQAIKAGKVTHRMIIVTVGINARATGNPVLKGSSLMFLKPDDRVKINRSEQRGWLFSPARRQYCAGGICRGQPETFVSPDEQLRQTDWPDKYPF